LRKTSILALEQAPEPIQKYYDIERVPEATPYIFLTEIVFLYEFDNKERP